MALNFAVVLDRKPTHNDFADNYFPRGFHYRREADELAVEVRRKGGQAHVVPHSQMGAELMRQLRRK